MNFKNFREYTDLETERWVVYDDILFDEVDTEIDINELDTIVDTSARIYDAQFIKLGNHCYIGPQVYLRGHITIGDMTWMGPFAQINGEGGCTIGKGVGVGNSVIILTCEHHQTDIEQPISFGELVKNPVMIGDGVNIGVGSIILPGVRAEKGVQIGAGSVVTKNTHLKEYEIWVGNPARLIGTRK